MFSKEKKNKEQIVIKLMKDETSLKISLCSKPGSVTSNGYLKSSKAAGAVISPDNLSGYLPVTKIRMFFALICNHKSLATLEHFLFCASWPVKTTSFILAITFCLVSLWPSLLLVKSVLELYAFVKV